MASKYLSSLRRDETYLKLNLSITKIRIIGDFRLFHKNLIRIFFKGSNVYEYKIILTDSTLLKLQ